MKAAASGYPDCYREFFTRLDGSINVTGKPGAWKAICPAHADIIQSLSVRVGAKGQLYVRCHAGGGCPPAAIVGAMGLTMDDLFPDNKRYTQHKGKPKMSMTETVYQYLDENGTLLFEAIRKEPKSFRQRRPNPGFAPDVPPSKENPEYLYNLEGVRRVPYRLPFLLSALSRTPDKMVMVVEGEKDVETAVSAGIIATCNPMGAGKWSDEYSQYLKGANVVVVPDEDEPGLAHAKAVCESLKGVARTVRMVRLPCPDPKPKGFDFSDWWLGVLKGTLEHKKNELKKLVNATPLYGTAEKSAPVTVPAGSVAPPKEEPKPAPVDPTPEPKKESTMPDPQDAKGTSAERFPNSPTIRGGAGLPNPAPGLIPEKKPATDAPKLVDVDQTQPADPPKPKEPGPLVLDPKVRAERVAAFIRDAKAAAVALKAAGFKNESPVAFYGALRMSISMLDQAFTLANGVPHLDNAVLGQISLMMGAYLFGAAADFGIGVGLSEEPKAPEPAK